MFRYQNNLLVSKKHIFKAKDELLWLIGVPMAPVLLRWVGRRRTDTRYLNSRCFSAQTARVEAYGGRSIKSWGHKLSSWKKLKMVWRQICHMEISRPSFVFQSVYCLLSFPLVCTPWINGFGDTMQADEKWAGQNSSRDEMPARRRKASVNAWPCMMFVSSVVKKLRPHWHVSRTATHSQTLPAWFPSAFVVSSNVAFCCTTLKFTWIRNQLWTWELQKSNMTSMHAVGCGAFQKLRLFCFYYGSWKKNQIKKSFAW